MPLVAGAAANWDVSLLTGLNDGDAVATLTEQVAGVSFTQGTAGNKPLYKTNIFGSLPALLFDGTDDHMATSSVDLDFDDTASFFAVLKQDTGGGTRQTVFGGDTAEHMQVELGIGSNTPGSGANRIVVIKSGTFLYESTNDQWIRSVNAVLSITRSGTGAGQTKPRANGVPATELQINAVTTADTGIVRRLGSRAGSNQFYKGYVGQLVIYSSALSASDVIDNEQFLAAKWNALLPGSRQPLPARRRSRFNPGLVYR